MKKKKKRTIKISSGKDKGRRLQQIVCKKVSKLINVPWGTDQPIESRPMGQKGPDIKLEPEARKLFPFTIECKNTEQWRVLKAIKQAQQNLYPHTDWLVIFKKNNVNPVAILDLDVFFRLLENQKKPEVVEKKASRLIL